MLEKNFLTSFPNSIFTMSETKVPPWPSATPVNKIFGTGFSTIMRSSHGLLDYRDNRSKILIQGSDHNPLHVLNCQNSFDHP